MSEFEDWKREFERNPEAFRERQKEERIFLFDKAVIRLQKLQNSMSGWDLEDWFGEQLGKHLWEKFINEHNRNILSWFNKLTNEYRFFMTTKLNNDERFS